MGSRKKYEKKKRAEMKLKVPIGAHRKQEIGSKIYVLKLKDEA